MITGASAGFGAAAARLFGAEGAKVLLGARRTERLEEVAQAAREAGAAAALFHHLDVTSTDSVDEFAAWVKEQTPNIDVLINNAGGAVGKDTVEEGRDEDWEFMMQTNVLGVLRMSRACIPLMKHHPGSMIVNVGSIAGRTAYEGGSAYCAAKAGELQITRALRLELCGTGMRVCTIDPGFAETEFSLVRFRGDAEAARKTYEGMDPLVAEDIAEAMVWVASRPEHVCIDEMVVKPTAQAQVYKIDRSGK